MIKKLTTSRYLVTFRAITAHGRACTHFEKLLREFMESIGPGTGEEWTATVSSLDKKNDA